MKRRNRFIGFPIGYQKDPEALYEIIQTVEVVRNSVRQLGPFFTFLFCMKFEEEKSTKEIAEAVGESTNYVNVYIHILRKKIKKSLD